MSICSTIHPPYCRQGCVHNTSWLTEGWMCGTEYTICRPTDAVHVSSPYTPFTTPLCPANHSECVVLSQPLHVVSSLCTQHCTSLCTTHQQGWHMAYNSPDIGATKQTPPCSLQKPRPALCTDCTPHAYTTHIGLSTFVCPDVL